MRRFAVVAAMLASVLVVLGQSPAEAACCPVPPCDGAWQPVPIPGTFDQLAVAVGDSTYSVGNTTSVTGVSRGVLDLFGAQQSTGGWGVVYRTDDNGTLNDVWSNGPDTWAAGSTSSKAMMLQIGPASFTPVVLNQGSLAAVDNGWAAGTGASGASVYSYDGTTWNQAAAPATSGLVDVSAENGGVWAVGTSSLSSWDGTSWTVHAPADPAAVLSAVLSVSPTEAWVAGSLNGNTYLAHFDSSGWTTTPGVLGALTDLAGAYVVGYAVGSTGRIPYVEHFNGATWTPVPVPAPSPDSYLVGVATTPGVTWAVGGRFHNATTHRSLSERVC